MRKINQRSYLLKRNIAGSIVIKAWSGLVQLLLVPLTLKCLNQYEYGVWLTINSLLVWIDQFDIGLGNGLRNRLAQSIAQHHFKRARKQVSTTFLMLTLIIIPIYIIISLGVQSVDVYKIFNTTSTEIPHLREILLMSFAFVCSTFILKVIGNIYLGLQLPAINNLIVVLGQTFGLVGIFILSKSAYHSFILVALIYCASPLLVYIIAYPITFEKYKFLNPSIKEFDFSELKGLLFLGANFFIVQLSGLIIFASSNLIISHLFSPAEVTPYQISYRYFSVPIMLFMVISSPLWSATTDAYTRNDWVWINHALLLSKQLTILFGILLIFMLFISNMIYKVWVGTQIHIPFSLTVAMSIYSLLVIYSTSYSNILFGIGKIRLISIITFIEALLYLPLSVLLGKKIGLTGIVLSLILVNILCAIFNRIQYVKLKEGTASGVWNK